MADYTGQCLTLIGTASIQTYLFASNELADNAGASQAVHEALEYWKKPRTAVREILYVGGGNAALIFANCDAARAATREWSQPWLRGFPNLRFIAVHRRIEGSLRQAYNDAQRDLFQSENRPPFGSPLGALPVVRNCPATGFGASERDPHETETWISADAASKRGKADAAYQRFRDDCYREVLKNCGLEPEFRKKFDELGVTEGASQIAVVHADGDGVGKLFSALADKAHDDEDFAASIHDLSELVNETGQDALRKTILDLVLTRDQWQSEEVRPENKRTGKFLVPLRAIVWGGDDLTFVTNGRLGLAATARYLKNFQEKWQEKWNERSPDSAVRRYLKDPKDPTYPQLTACAGVAVVPLKFPFSRAYHLADELTREAKKARRDNGRGGAWMDFQLVLEGAAGSLKSTRQEMYASEARKADELLRSRPYRVDASDWRQFEEDWRSFSRRNWPRNRVKRALEAIVAGDHTAEPLLATFRARGYALPRAGVSARAFFDVLEMLDYHTVIDWDKPAVKIAAAGGG